MTVPAPSSPPHRSPEHRRRRFRRNRRRAYIRSVYALPSLATLGNAICGFGAIYVAALTPGVDLVDPVAARFAQYQFTVAAYLIFAAMVFDALDGRLARFARHTTDFGGQLDSLADVISFGAAPAFLALQVFKTLPVDLPLIATRLVWAFGALYMSCAAMRLARFNVSNEHGEQHHFSFLGLPSPGAGGTVAAFILMQQELADPSNFSPWFLDTAHALWQICLWVLPFVVLATGLLMVSNVRYPHMVNRYLRGRRSFGRLVAAVCLVLGLFVAFKYVLAIGTLVYTLWGPVGWLMTRWRRPSTTTATTPTAG